MDKKRLKEILAAHADQLNRSEQESPAQPLAEEDEELTTLLNVAKQVQSTLTPLTPDTNFETELKRELLATAHLRQAQGYIPPNPERDLLILAAVMGLFVGIVSIWVFLRLRH
jgi:hypothetical protein